MNRKHLSLLLLASVAAAGPLRAEEVSSFSVEINRLDAAGPDCRVTLVEKNSTPSAVASLKLDLAVFDKDGIVVKRVGVDAGPLKAGRSVVKTFDLKDLPCDSVGRLLLNGVIACEAGGLSTDACFDMIEPRTRAAAFDK